VFRSAVSDGHHCLGVWRQMARTTGVALIGAVSGLVAVSLLTDRPSDSLFAVAGVLGAVLITGSRRTSDTLPSGKPPMKENRVTMRPPGDTNNA
jgi:hypothetical protein